MVNIHGKAISSGQIKELKDHTGVSFMDCKAALTEANGNMDRAGELLAEWGLIREGEQADSQTTANESGK